MKKNEHQPKFRILSLSTTCFVLSFLNNVIFEFRVSNENMDYLSFSHSFGCLTFLAGLLLLYKARGREEDRKRWFQNATASVLAALTLYSLLAEVVSALPHPLP